MSAHSRPVPAAYGLAARLFAGAVLVYAGATKAAAPAEEFALVVGAYGLLPKDAVLTAAHLLPWAELLLGWSLILGFRVRAAAAGCGALFAAFITGLLSVKLRGVELPNCGCFGDAVHLTTLQALAMDSALLSLCAVAWKADPGLSLDSWSAKGR